MEKTRKFSFLAHTGGNYAITFALVAVPLFMSAGAALDYSKVYGSQEEIHVALDAAVLAGVNLSAKEKKQGAESADVAKTQFAGNYSGELASLRFWMEGDILHGEAKTSTKTSMLALMGIRELPVKVHSAATAVADKQPACFMAMHPYRKHTLEMKDEVKVYAPDCHIYGNSSHPDDVVDPHSPLNFLTGKSIQAVGYGHHYIENVSPPLAYAPEILPDPLAGMNIPGPGSCTATNKVVLSSHTKLTPGTYCGGLTIKNARFVEFSSGTYVITGKFDVSSSQVYGSDVTIVLSGNNGSLDWESSDVSFRAPRTGPMAGMVVVADRVPSENQLTRSTVDLHGVIYMLNGVFEWENTGNPKIKADWTSWIIDGVSWTGEGTLEIPFDIAKGDIPFPAALQYVIPLTGPSRVRLVQ